MLWYPLSILVKQTSEGFKKINDENHIEKARVRETHAQIFINYPTDYLLWKQNSWKRLVGGTLCPSF